MPSNLGIDLPAACHELAADIRAGEVAILAGAGISFRSGLPLVAELVPYLLSKFDLAADDTGIIRAARLPFEALFELLRRHTHIHHLYEVFRGGRPNTTHLLLGKLFHAGLIRFVVTTNFDTLLEDAVSAEGWRAGVDYDLLGENEQNTGEHSGNQLVKIHGSITRPESIAITLAQVAGRDLSAARKQFIHHLFSTGPHRQVLILGYSCSDIFDISPAIEKIVAERKRIILVQHSMEDRVEDIAKGVDQNPFRRYFGVRIFADTDRLVVALWRQLLGPTDPPASLSGAEAWRDHVDMWAQQNRERIPAFASFVPAMLLHNIGRYECALVYAERAAAQCRSARDSRGEAYAIRIKGLAHHGLSQFGEAITCYKAALQVAQSSNDPAGIDADLGNLAASYLKLGDYEAADRCAQQRRTFAGARGGVAAKDDLQQSVARRVAGDLDGAVKHAKAGRDEAQISGDPKAEAVALGNEATALRNSRRYNEALSRIDEALQLYCSISDRSGKGVALGNKGNILIGLRELDRARQCLEEAIQIARETHDRYAESVRLGNLAAIHADLDQSEMAIELLERGLSIAEEIGVAEVKARHLWNLGNLHEQLGNLSEAQRLRVLARELLGPDHPMFR